MLASRMTLALLLFTIPVIAQNRAETPTITAKTAGLQKIDGYMPLYWDAGAGKLWLEISRFNTELLYQVSLAAGVGSNPLGLDRGQLGGTHIVAFERSGPKVLMVEPNYSFRAISPNEAERRAVADSFARSVLWGFRIEAAEDDRVLVDATPFFLRDAHGVGERLRQSRQGSYRYDDLRSAFYLPRTRGFPQNTEIETVITLTADGEIGPLVRSVAPTAGSVTVRQHHSFIQLPDNQYRPRRLDPRVGVFGISFYDYASPFTEPIEKRWISRHRLEKRDPNAAVSEPVKPIVYYVDNGAPEPIRTALIEGAQWWAAAFEAAGFRNAFQVRVLPEDADPMDVRYNMINWVHRSTRGWSYGASITDPRTGEIIKGNVTLGSLRIRQDYTLGTGMIPPYGNRNSGMGTDNNEGCAFGDIPELEYLAQSDPATDSAAMSLSRIRQLSAHEVGHTIGLSHNFAASTYARASVMDYPAPWVEINNGRLDLSNAYTAGIGEYDKFAVQYAYSQFRTNADEAVELERLIQAGQAAGMLFITDSDARPPGAAHPLASLWDNGADPVATLRHEMEVRRIGMDNFGLSSIPAGTPLSLLEAKFLPLYLHHRYQLQAAVKTLGGVYYTYAVRTASGPSPGRVREVAPADRQREALQAVLDTLKPETLAIPKRILDLIPPRAFGYGGGTAEYFARRTSPDFDPVGAATIAADLAISGLLNAQRAARLVQFKAMDANNPGFDDVVQALFNQLWPVQKPQDAYHVEILWAERTVCTHRLMELAADQNADAAVRAIALNSLRETGSKAGATEPNSRGFYLQQEIDRFLNRPEVQHRATPPLPVPAGDPIGSRNQ
ncbi:MAG: zinc-dependent metalloprotease [Acidobacteria bacterium]|nr:zinc-dependent metalloprotease [Acidobacteriota bacterium]